MRETFRRNQWFIEGNSRGDDRKRNTEEEIEQWTEKHRAAAAIYDTPFEEIENRIVTLKREKEAYDAEQKERRNQRRLEEEKRLLETQMEMKKK